MSYLESIIQGILQGLTEFLPVSSSGHLNIVHGIFGKGEPLPLIFTVILHLFSLMAVILVFRKTLFNVIIGFFKALKDRKSNDNFKLAMLIVVATIPTAIIGLLFEDFIETHLTNPLLISIILFFNGILLFVSKYFKQKDRDITYIDAIIIGIIQGLAITPGISRSGSTISTAILLGVGREKAGTFSFLLSIPAILGAVVLKYKAFLTLESSMLITYLTGGIFAFIVGYFSLVFLLKLIKKGKFYIFAYYCWIVSTAAIIYFIQK